MLTITLGFLFTMTLFLSFLNVECTAKVKFHQELMVSQYKWKVFTGKWIQFGQCCLQNCKSFVLFKDYQRHVKVYERLGLLHPVLIPNSVEGDIIPLSVCVSIYLKENWMFDWAKTCLLLSSCLHLLFIFLQECRKNEILLSKLGR